MVQLSQYVLKLLSCVIITKVMTLKLQNQNKHFYFINNIYLLCNFLDKQNIFLFIYNDIYTRNNAHYL